MGRTRATTPILRVACSRIGCHARAMSRERQAAEAGGWTPSRRRKTADSIAEVLGHAGPDPSDLQLAGIAVLTESAAIGTDLAAERALREAWTLSAARTPPKGSVQARRTTATTRLVRAVGAGWSLVARTDGPAILVLDTVANTAIDIKDNALFQGLLAALTAAAARAQP